MRPTSVTTLRAALRLRASPARSVGTTRCGRPGMPPARGRITRRHCAFRRALPFRSVARSVPGRKGRRCRLHACYFCNGIARSMFAARRGRWACLLRDGITDGARVAGCSGMGRSPTATVPRNSPRNPETTLLPRRASLCGAVALKRNAQTSRDARAAKALRDCPRPRAVSRDVVARRVSNPCSAPRLSSGSGRHNRAGCAGVLGWRCPPCFAGTCARRGENTGASRGRQNCTAA